jgi:hypothetical protein
LDGLKPAAWVRNPHIFAGSALKDMVILSIFYYVDFNDISMEGIKVSFNSIPQHERQDPDPQRISVKIELGCESETLLKGFFMNSMFPRYAG